MTDATNLLLRSHLKQLRLPTIAAEFSKLAREAAELWREANKDPRFPAIVERHGEENAVSAVARIQTQSLDEVLAAAAGGLVLALGLTERRRTFAITSLLGATRTQLRGLVLGEAVVIAGAGIAAGAVSAWLLSQMLVTVLTGVFDPPPATLTVPWGYLVATIAIAALAVGATALQVSRRSSTPAIESLREI